MDQIELKALTDAALLAKVSALSSKENETTVELLLHLAEVDRRKLYLEQGYGSLYSYCVRGLRYSEPAANRRIACARVVLRFPGITKHLLTRELSLSTLSLVASILNEDNGAEVLDAIKGKSRREVELYVAGYRPRQRQPQEVVRPLVVAKPAPQAPAGELFKVATAQKYEERKPINSTFAGEGTGPQLSAAAESHAQPKAAPKHEPAQEQRFELRFSVSAAALQKLEEAKAALSGKYPRGVKIEDVFEEALELLLEKRSPARRVARRQAAELKRERAKRCNHGRTAPCDTAALSTPSTSGDVPAALRDEVFVRDGGQCTFIGPDGVRCGSRHNLEVHHIDPRGQGGPNTKANLVVRCAGHNLFEAIQDYGPQCMKPYLSPGWAGKLQAAGAS